MLLCHLSVAPGICKIAHERFLLCCGIKVHGTEYRFSQDAKWQHQQRLNTVLQPLAEKRKVTLEVNYIFKPAKKRKDGAPET